MQTEPIPENNSPVGALRRKGAATYLSVSLTTLNRLIERRLIHPNRATRHLLFPIADLNRFLLNPANTARHSKLPPQSRPGANNWKTAVANSQRNRRQAAK